MGRGGFLLTSHREVAERQWPAVPFPSAHTLMPVLGPSDPLPVPGDSAQLDAVVTTLKGLCLAREDRQSCPTLAGASGSEASPGPRFPYL